MLSSLLIILREGLEAALIIGIILAYLSRTGNRQGFKPVWLGTGLAVVVSLLVGGIIYLVAGEMSGHIFFADDFFGFDDALYVAARLVQLLSRTDKTLSELQAVLPIYYSTPEMRMACESDEEKFRIAKEAEEFFIANYDCSTVDGVRIKFGDGWGLVRSSNTQPVIVCRFEANTQERMEEIKDLVLSKLLTIGKLEIEVGH